MSALYSIRPIKWVKSFDTYRQTYSARVPMGSYTVERYREDWEDGKPWQEWKWGYCFDEYYDEDKNTCESLAEGKKKAEENWHSRILPALNEHPK